MAGLTEVPVVERVGMAAEPEAMAERVESGAEPVGMAGPVEASANSSHERLRRVVRWSHWVT